MGCLSFIAKEFAIDCMPVKVVPVKVKEFDSLKRGLSLWGKKIDSLKDSLTVGGERIDTFEERLPMRKKKLNLLEEPSLRRIFFKYLLVYIWSAALMPCGMSEGLRKYLLHSFST